MHSNGHSTQPSNKHLVVQQSVINKWKYADCLKWEQCWSCDTLCKTISKPWPEHQDSSSYSTKIQICKMSFQYVLPPLSIFCNTIWTIDAERAYWTFDVDSRRNCIQWSHACCIFHSFWTIQLNCLATKRDRILSQLGLVSVQTHMLAWEKQRDRLKSSHEIKWHSTRWSKIEQSMHLTCHEETSCCLW
jgi:hypothetical protein